MQLIWPIHRSINGICDDKTPEIIIIRPSGP
jgi:hypothetical protein